MTTAILIFSGITGATISAGILAYYWGDLRRVAAEIDRESEHGFRLPQTKADKQAKREGAR